MPQPPQSGWDRCLPQTKTARQVWEPSREATNKTYPDREGGNGQGDGSGFKRMVSIIPDFL